MDIRRRKEEIELLIKWKNMPVEMSTWELWKCLPTNSQFLINSLKKTIFLKYLKKNYNLDQFVEKMSLLVLYEELELRHGTSSNYKDDPLFEEGFQLSSDDIGVDPNNEKEIEILRLIGSAYRNSLSSPKRPKLKSPKDLKEYDISQDLCEKLINMIVHQEDKVKIEKEE